MIGSQTTDLDDEKRCPDRLMGIYTGAMPRTQSTEELRFDPPLPLPLDETAARLFDRLCLVHVALSQLLYEVTEAGFMTATDYNWPKAIADAKEALSAR